MGSARTDDVEDGNAGVLADRDRIVVIMPGGLVATTTLHAIALDLHAFIADLEWTVNAYTLPFAVLPMAGAAFGERSGRRRVLIGGLRRSPASGRAGSAPCGVSARNATQAAK